MQVKCPSCRQEIEWEKSPFRPFCSEHCKTRDLGDWASEKYRIPVQEESPGETDGKKKEKD